MVEQIITWAVVGVAAFLLLQHLWEEFQGFIHEDRAGHCAKCGMCETGEAVKAGKKASRPAPEIKMTPVIPLQTRRPENLPPLPEHLRKLREQAVRHGEPRRESE